MMKAFFVKKRLKRERHVRKDEKSKFYISNICHGDDLHHFCNSGVYNVFQSCGFPEPDDSLADTGSFHGLCTGVSHLSMGCEYVKKRNRNQDFSALSLY